MIDLILGNKNPLIRLFKEKGRPLTTDRIVCNHHRLSLYFYTVLHWGYMNYAYDEIHLDWINEAYNYMPYTPVFIMYNEWTELTKRTSKRPRDFVSDYSLDKVSFPKS